MIQDLNAMKLDWCEVGDARNAIVSYFNDPSRNCSIECLINHCSVQKKKKYNIDANAKIPGLFLNILCAFITKQTLVPIISLFP